MYVPWMIHPSAGLRCKWNRGWEGGPHWDGQDGRARIPSSDSKAVRVTLPPAPDSSLQAAHRWTTDNSYNFATLVVEATSEYLSISYPCCLGDNNRSKTLTTEVE